MHRDWFSDKNLPRAVSRSRMRQWGICSEPIGFFFVVRRAARPAPSKLQSRNRERPRGSSVIALARVPQPPTHPPRDILATDKQERVSAPPLLRARPPV